MELEFIDVIKANIGINNPQAKAFHIWHGDARSIGQYLAGLDQRFDLIVNNPPYSGDESQKGLKVREGFEYNKDLPNLAFLKEGPTYYETIGSIYAECVKKLRKGGRLVIGVKDQMRKKQPDMLHAKLTDAVLKYVPGMEFEGTAVLKHYPTTLFLNTYFRQFGIHPPYYQSIMVLKKVK
jgi:methylase of polypeptide subunit release factors